MNKHDQKPTDMFNKQDVTVYLTYSKMLKDVVHIPEAIFKLLYKVLKRRNNTLQYFENDFWNVKSKI